MTNVHLGKRDSGGAGRRRHPLACFAIACWLLFVAPEAFSKSEEGVEYPVKLAFLYNFTKFVEWPASSYRDAGAPLTICIVGRDPFSPEIESDLRRRLVASHPVEVLNLKLNDTLSGCHIVFLPATEKDQAEKIVTELRASSILTVGESEGFGELGGIINLTLEGNDVHFEVNQLAAQRAGLKISSKLLSLAKIVTDHLP